VRKGLGRQVGAGHFKDIKGNIFNFLPLARECRKVSLIKEESLNEKTQYS
jgi:hypothetical protein